MPYHDNVRTSSVLSNQHRCSVKTFWTPFRSCQAYAHIYWRYTAQIKLRSSYFSEMRRLSAWFESGCRQRDNCTTPACALGPPRMCNTDPSSLQDEFSQKVLAEEQIAVPHPRTSELSSTQQCELMAGESLIVSECLPAARFSQSNRLAPASPIPLSSAISTSRRHTQTQDQCQLKLHLLLM